MHYKYTFANDGTGVREYYFFGNTEYRVPQTIWNTLEDARNTEWDWVTFEFLEPEIFTWEFHDDFVVLKFLDFDFEQTLKLIIAENELVLLMQEPDITLYKEQ